MPYIDLSFRIQGSHIPADHGYHLYSAISRSLPATHANGEVGVHPISGQLLGNRLMSVNDRSRLILRIDASRMGEFLPLAGKEINIAGHKLRIGVPTPQALVPAARLYSRLVIIKGFVEPQPFLEAVQRQLDELGVRASPSLVEQQHIAEANKGKDSGSHSPVLRRTIHIRDKNIVGFAVRVEELTADESIRLQEVGIGGRRRFGCGVFIPERR
jgi:CRISPR-associated protein Cas6